MVAKSNVLICRGQNFLFWPPEGKQVTQVKAIVHLLITVPDDGQIKELASMLLGQDRVYTRSVRAHQLLIYCQVISW